MTFNLLTWTLDIWPWHFALWPWWPLSLTLTFWPCPLWPLTFTFVTFDLCDLWHLTFDLCYFWPWPFELWPWPLDLWPFDLDLLTFDILTLTFVTFDLDLLTYDVCEILTFPFLTFRWDNANIPLPSPLPPPPSRSDSWLTPFPSPSPVYQCVVKWPKFWVYTATFSHINVQAKYFQLKITIYKFLFNMTEMNRGFHHAFIQHNGPETRG